MSFYQELLTDPSGRPPAVKARLLERAKMEVPAAFDTLFVSERLSC
jgi:hypothetical protein